MSWTELNPDDKHRIFRCSSCKRLGVTGKDHGSEKLGQCVCMKGTSKR